MSIINGLFSGRSGIASHGQAIGVAGDNISNASTIGYKASRAEFEDVMAGGQSSNQSVGSGSSLSAVSTVFQQGTLEFTGRSLDLAIDGNGYFIVQSDTNRYYTRAGNFKVDSDGYIITQKGDKVLGFPEGGNGSLQELNINNISQSNIATQNVAFSGNLDATATTLANGAADIPTVNGTSTTTYAELNAVAAFSTVNDIFDSLGGKHTVTSYFYKTGASEYTARAYVNSEEVDSPVTTTGLPRQIGTATMTFDATGTRTNAPSSSSQDFTATIAWNNGASQTATVDFTYGNFTMYATSANISSITGDGDGVGAITSLSIDKEGQLFALLDNGQASTIATLGIATFSNPEGLSRIGANRLQESSASGAPIVGRPGAGTFGNVEAGSIELSTVDLANEFVKIITLQRGFQANSRIIQLINGLLNEIVQLA